MNPHHWIVSGLGAVPRDSNGNAWTSDYIVASGNLMADFRFNVTAESMGRLQVSRLYEITEDHGVRRLLSFLIARDTMHQNQWLAAMEELKSDGLGDVLVPDTFPQELEYQPVSYQFWNCSAGTESAEGRWASGVTPDGRGQFEYLATPEPLGETVVQLEPVTPATHNTPPVPMRPSISDEKP
jgi:Mn-containing catalase